MALQKIPTETTIDDFGAYLLANLARGIYNYEAVLREYVQNAGDAYLDLPRMPKKPVITIRTVGKDTLTIQDNGIGMELADLQECKKIGVSSKGRRRGRAGFRGIGIWAGFQACNLLEIETTKKGSDIRYVLQIDFADILRHVHDNINLKKLLDGRVSISRDTEKVDKDESYTLVKLVGLQGDYLKLLNEQDLLRIASQILPCKVDPSFEHHAALAAFLQAVPGYQEFVIKVNNSEAHKQFPPELQVPETKVLEKDGVEYARVWRCTGDQSIVPQGFQYRNFRLRVLNFAVGRVGIYDDEDGTTFEDKRKLKSRAHLNWHVGEIHITNPDIRPDTPRSHLEFDGLAKKAIELIRGYYEDAIVASRARNTYLSADRLIEAAEAALEDPSLLDRSKVQNFLSLLANVEEMVEERETRDRVKIRVRQMLSTRTMTTRRQNVTDQMTDLLASMPEPAPSGGTNSPTRGTGGGRETNTGRSGTNSAGSSANGGSREPVGRGTATEAVSALDSVTAEALLSEVIAAVEDILGEDDDLCREVADALQAVFLQHGLINA
jgi:hypothetical protein